MTATHTLHRLVAEMVAAAEADPDLHNGYNDCDDADCVPCNEALDERDRVLV